MPQMSYKISSSEIVEDGIKIKVINILEWLIFS